MTARSRLEELTPALRARGLEELELFLKSGRSRRYELGAHGRQVSSHRERGWAVRASSSRASLLASGTGLPRPSGPWPPADGYPIPLPPPVKPGEWRAPADLEAPLILESEALPLLEAVERRLLEEVEDARVVRLALEDGSSRVEIASSRGVEAEHGGRAASLLIEVVRPSTPGGHLVELFAEREGRRFSPRDVAQRIANRLIVQRDGERVGRDRGEFLLAPPVAARVVSGCRMLVLGPGAARRARALADRSDRLASDALNLVDDGGMEGGLLTAPVDGEGVPTCRLSLIAGGVFRRALKPWWQEEDGEPIVGCVRRAGWRDLPRPGPSHLHVEPDPSTSVSSLLAGVTRGYYFTEALGPGRFDLEANRFQLPVCGFQVRSGRPVKPVAQAMLAGRLSALLRGVQGVGRDLRFFSLDGLCGAPTLLVGGGAELEDR